MMLFGLLGSACATEPHSQPITLADVLNVLQTVSTISELYQKLGPPAGETIFDYDNPKSPDIYGRLPRESWKDGMIITPANLIDSLPVGTRVLEYDFTARHSDINPLGAAVWVFVDSEGRIVGYMRNRNYLGAETEAVIQQRP